MSDRGSQGRRPPGAARRLGASLVGALVAVIVGAVIVVLVGAAPAPAAVPDDQFFGLQWGDENLGQVIPRQNQEEKEELPPAPGTPGADDRAALAWSLTTGSRSIVVAVVDTGVDSNHPDLVGNVWTNPGGIGGCPAGTHGFNVLALTPLEECDADDTDTAYGGHGTHVAGIIGASGNNGIGIAGMNWQTTLLPVRWLERASESPGPEKMQAALEKVLQAKQAGVNVRVVNVSATFDGEEESPPLRAAIEALGREGILLVSAAGNTMQDIDEQPYKRFPCDYHLPNEICVTATDDNDALPTWADWGVGTVDLAAPGVSIYSTLREGYGYLTGTSMATAQVSGAAALILSVEPSLTVAQLKADILEHVDRLPSLEGKVATAGRLDVCRAIPACPAMPPSASTGAATGVTSTTATLNGTTNPNGQADSCRFEYGVSTSYGGSVPCAASPGAGLGPVAVSAAVGGLAPSRAYHFRLVSTNATGTAYGADQVLTTLASVPPSRPVPEVRLLSRSLAASRRGILTVKLSCPASAGSCRGTITIRSQRKGRARPVLLAHGSFTIRGGHVLVLRLHLSRRARGLLARHHRVAAAASVSARDPAGGTFARRLVVTIHLLAPRRR